MQQRDKVYLGGKWVPSAAAGTIDVVSPSTEAMIARVPAGDTRDVDAAVRAARAAFPAWSATRPGERAACVSRIHDGLKARADEVARTISMEVGTPLKLAQRIQAALPVKSFALSARLATEFQFEEQVGPFAGSARAGRRGRLHHPLELPAAPDRRQGGPRARGRLHRGATSSPGAGASSASTGWRSFWNTSRLRPSRRRPLADSECVKSECVKGDPAPAGRAGAARA